MLLQVGHDRIDFAQNLPVRAQVNRSSVEVTRKPLSLTSDWIWPKM